MSATVVPVPQYENATPLVRTVDGELISDLSGPAPYAPLVQTLADRAQYARGGLWGHLEWSGRFAVDPGGTSTVFVVRVGAIEALCVCQAGDGLTTGTWRPHYNASETTLALANVEGSPAALSADTWYYVYAWSNGTLKFLINTTPPATGMVWQSAGGAPTRRYLGCFRTNGAGAPLPLRAHRGRYWYRVSAIGTTSLQALFGGSATAWADLALGTYGLPPHARLAHVEVVLSSVAYDVELRTKGDTSAYRIVQSLRAQLALETDSSQTVQYQVSNALASADVNVLGWEE